MKKKYDPAEITVIVFESKDVIVTSDGIGEDGGEDDGEWS